MAATINKADDESEVIEGVKISATLKKQSIIRESINCT